VALDNEFSLHHYFTAIRHNTLQHTVTHSIDFRAVFGRFHVMINLWPSMNLWWMFTSLHHTAAHCNTLHTVQHTAAHCSTLQHTAIHRNTLARLSSNFHMISCGSKLVALDTPSLRLYFTATLSNALQHTATHCNCNTLHHTATHYNTMLHAATHYTTLQRTHYTVVQFPDDFMQW